MKKINILCAFAFLLVLQIIIQLKIQTRHNLIVSKLKDSVFEEGKMDENINISKLIEFIGKRFGFNHWRAYR